MRGITEFESYGVSGGIIPRELTGVLAWQLSFLGFYYYFIMPLSDNINNLPVILPITAAVNVSGQTALGKVFYS